RRWDVVLTMVNTSRNLCASDELVRPVAAQLPAVPAVGIEGVVSLAVKPRVANFGERGPDLDERGKATLDGPLQFGESIPLGARQHVHRAGVYGICHLWPLCACVSPSPAPALVTRRGGPAYCVSAAIAEAIASRTVSQSSTFITRTSSPSRRSWYAT